MKQFLIFSIFVCFAAAGMETTEESEIDEAIQAKTNLAMEECAQEYDVDDDENDSDGDEVKLCVEACFFRKLVHENLAAADNKETLYNGFTKLIEEIYKETVQPEIPEEIVSYQIQECYTSASDECEFYKCSVRNARLDEVISFISQDVMQRAFDD